MHLIVFFSVIRLEVKMIININMNSRLLAMGILFRLN